MTGPRNVGGRPGGRISKPGQHRTMVYCDDYGQLYGYWCLDCPDRRQPYTTKPSAERLASHHRRDPTQAPEDAHRKQMAQQRERKQADAQPEQTDSEAA